MQHKNSGLESRQMVLDILSDLTHRFKKESIAESLDTSSLNPADRRLVTELVQGITRHSQTLRHIVRHYSRRMPQEPIVQNSLLLGLYQLLFMDKIPWYAAIHTTIELLKQNRRPLQETQYANAILRKVQRSVAWQEAGIPSPCFLPIAGTTGWQFSDKLFPNPQANQEAYWATVYSYPQELVQRWYRAFGAEVCQKLLAAGNMSPPVFLRVRPNITSDALVDKLRQAGILFTCCHSPELIQLSQSGDIAQLPGIAQGECVVAGPTAVAAITALAPQPGQTVLDLCAAPGGKSLLIVDLMQDRGSVVACDSSPDRLRLLQATQNRLHLRALTIHQMDATALPAEFHQAFDCVVADVPCSNSAVLGKRAEARWRFTAEKLQELAAVQRQILDSAALAVRAGGSLLYSTCSLEPEENEQVIDAFLVAHPDFVCIFRQQILPLPPFLDGGTFGVLRR